MGQVKGILVLGAGGHAKVLVNALLAISAEVIGVIDANPEMAGRDVLGIPIVGDDSYVGCLHADRVRLVNGIGSIGEPVLRRKVFSKFKSLGYSFFTVVHPSTVVAVDVDLQEGAQVMAGCVIQPGCRIGSNAIINTRASVDHDCAIGDHVHLAPGVTLSGGVTVGSSSHIGTGATVIQGITIGERVIVAAGAVVVCDLPDGAVVRGVPAR